MPNFIDANIPDVVRSFDRLRREQVPFATALALTRTAQDAQAQVRDEMPRRFTLRRRWLQSGIRIERATKRDLRAAVKSRDKMLTKHEFGGTKRPFRGHLAVPSRDLGGSQRKRPIPKRQRPSAILNRPRAFIGSGLGPSNLDFIGQRQRKARRPIHVWYILIERGRIDPRFGFEGTVRLEVEQQFDKRFGEALGKALRTAR